MGAPVARRRPRSGSLLSGGPSHRGWHRASPLDARCELWFTSYMAYRPTERTEARKAAVRARIVTAARHLIARGGYAEAQISAVAAEAGVATGTVYRHL